MQIKDVSYKWNGTLVKRNSTEYIILHHRAGNGDVHSLHNGHLSNGWSGIGYHFYVRKDGTIYRGRPIEMVGAHCTGQNTCSVGVCFEGNFENEAMSDVQIKAGQELISYIKSLYPYAKVMRHRDFNETACPGKNFPNDIGGVVKTTKQHLETGNDIVWELMNGKHKIEITEVQRAIKAIDDAKKNENFSSLYWILYKIVNK